MWIDWDICIMISVCSSYYNSVLSLVILSYGVNGALAGYVFAVPCFTYAISSICVTYIVKRFPRRLLIFVSFIVTTLSLFMMGPSEVLGFPNYLWLLVLGLALNGTA